MIAATSTMWDTLGWGGETQALIYNPNTRKVIGVNALGVAPTGATPEFYRSKGYDFPPEFGPLAAVTPGTPGGIMVMLAEYGKLSLAEVLAPAIEMADGYPIEAQTADLIEKWKDELRKWPESRRTFLMHEGKDGKPLPGYSRVGPEAGEIFRQPDLAVTLRKLVDTEAKALKAGKNRKQAIMAAYDRFYKGDIAKEFSRGSQELGGLHTPEDLANWQVYLEEPVSTNYKGIEVYKLTHWVQGPSMLQALNILENFDLKSMGYNSTRYIHTLYQTMSLAFADRDFYYGDSRFPPEEPIKGLLSKDYARERAQAGQGRSQRSRYSSRRSVSLPGGDQSVPGAARCVAHGQARQGQDRSRISGARRRSPNSIAPSGSAPPASKPSIRKVGSSPSRRAAAGCRRPSRARPASA